MKRYLLFAGYIYYPIGGIDDLKGQFDSPGAAEKEADQWARKDTWYQIVDIRTGDTIKTHNS